MRTPSTRLRRIALNGAGPVAVLLAGALVWQGSHAAFTAETYNPGNNWNAGSVVLSDDGSGTAMFNVHNLVPGDTGFRCIVVTGTSDVTGVVRMYFKNATPEGLEDNITLTVERGAGSAFADPDCTDFEADTDGTHELTTLGTFFTDHATYENGILEWAKTPGEHSKTYKFTWTFDTGTMTQHQIDALQGTSVRTDIEWELQNN